ARATEPSRRFADAAAMQRALAACLVDPAASMAKTPASRSRRRLLAGAAAALALATAVATGWWLRAPPPLQAEVRLLRHRGDVVEPIADGAPIALGDRLSFTVNGTQPLWLYAFNADDHGTLQRLFPLRGLDTTNP